MRTTDYHPATEAFSFLAQKQSSKGTAREVATLAGLFSLMTGAILLPLPEAWGVGVETLSLRLRLGLDVGMLVVKALLFSEALFYLLHRYFEHVGLVSRLSAFVRKNQQYHWIHHMVIYPFNKQYKKGTRYAMMKRDFHSPLWHFMLSVLIIIATIATMGITWKGAVFVGVVTVYSLMVPQVHDRFHFFNSWEKNQYFRWLADIHMLHHVDQEANFTIFNPLMDMLFGTYFSPQKFSSHIRSLLESNDVNFSDFISFSYLIQEATPLERATFIAALAQFPGERKKVHTMVELLSQVPVQDPYYVHAGKLREALASMLELSGGLYPHPLTMVPNSRFSAVA